MSISDQYIAGFFDGEGHVNNYSRAKQIVFTQNDRTILDFIVQAYPGGRIRKSRVRSQNGCHALMYNGHQAIPILEAMFPYLIGKRFEVQMYLIDHGR